MQRHHIQPAQGNHLPDAAPADERRRPDGPMPDPEPAADEPAERLSDAERYQWIRAHRGSALITTALLGADSDYDLDARIDEAVRAQRMGRPLPRSSLLVRPVYGRRRTD